MTCEPWIEEISARADGEPPAIDDRLLDSHLATCTACRAFASDVSRLARAATVGVAPQHADMAGSIVRAARAADRGSVWWALRLGLGIVALQVVVLSAPALLLGHSDGSNEHSARHLGSFATAYAIGLLVVALRPAKARGMLPLAAALAGCLMITAIIDIAEGRRPLVAEIRHVPELIGLVLVWLLAAPKRLPSSAAPSRLPKLSIVDDRDGIMRESS